jgi:hypothetical protein
VALLTRFRQTVPCITNDTIYSCIICLLAKL